MSDAWADMAAARSRPQPAEGLDRPSLVYVLGRVDHGIRREMRKRLVPWQLGVPEYTALSVLRARPGLSNAQLARRSLVAPQSMIEILARLETRGLVRRRADPHHALVRRAELTVHGRATLEAAEPSIAALQEQLLADVAPTDRDVVLRGLLSAMEKLSGGSQKSGAAGSPT
jgi:DNA-binding MarR family transcriptional regulator